MGGVRELVCIYCCPILVFLVAKTLSMILSCDSKWPASGTFPRTE